MLIMLDGVGYGDWSRYGSTKINMLDLQLGDKVRGTPTFVLDDVDQFTVTASPVREVRIAHADHREL